PDMKIIRRLVGLLRHRGVDDEMRQEMRLHLELEETRNQAAGMAGPVAREMAARSFGNVAAWQERAREQRFGHYLDAWSKDLRSILGSLRRAPAFALTVFGTLLAGLGIALFGLDLAPPEFLRREPFPEPARLVVIGNARRDEVATVVRSFQFSGI